MVTELLITAVRSGDSVSYDEGGEEPPLRTYGEEKEQERLNASRCCRRRLQN